MSFSTLLPDMPGLVVERVILGEAAITLVARLAARKACCPGCAQPSSRIHSYARRTLWDLPISGRRVQLSLQVRRFRCGTPTCPRRTFRERIATRASPRVHRTVRLLETLCQVAFALGGEAGARLARGLGLPCSPDTLLHLIRHYPVPAAPTPRVLGVDDFSFHKGRTFGTILLDLERRVPIDLLPDREAPTLAAWLTTHAGVDIISRDRGGTYADGARQGAPAAHQTADRWHLLKNLGDTLEGLFLHKKQALKDAVPRSHAPPPDRPADAPWATGRTKEAEANSLRRHAHFVELYHHIQALAATGLRVTDIAEQVQMSRGAVYHYLHMDQPPERRSPQDRRSRPLDRYKPYLLQRWDEGIRNSKQLWRELVAQGYQQSSGPVQRFIGPLRQQTGKPHKFKAEAAASHYRPEEVRQRPLTALQATRLLTSKEGQRTPWQQAYLNRLLAADPALEQTYRQVQTFCEMVRQCQGERLDQWLAEVQECAVAELRAFAQGLVKDYEAVKNGLTWPWSNGPTEGHIHRLKFIKRTMYGRASFMLLRQRVLHAFGGQHLHQVRKEKTMISNQGRDPRRQGRPEKCKEQGRLGGIISVEALFMLPGGRRMPMTPKMIKAALLDLIPAKIDHVTRLLPKEATYRQLRQASFFPSFPQHRRFWTFLRFHRFRRNLNACFWSKEMAKHQQLVLMGDVREHFVFDRPHCKKRLLLCSFNQDLHSLVSYRIREGELAPLLRKNQHTLQIRPVNSTDLRAVGLLSHLTRKAPT